MNDLYAVILSWAVTLTGYQMPAAPPEHDKETRHGHYRVFISRSAE
jgi:hypothetical protein